jgi:threonine dehydrogenase-like Zn-dependent dehydrogenase
MQAAILFAERQVRFDQVPEPRPRAGEVLIEVASAGICGTDLHVYRGEFRDRVRYPAILGHEFGGVVVEVGPEASGVRRGDRVAVDPILPCYACPACRTGRFNACHSLRLLGIDLPGGFAEYVVAPASHAYLLPDSVSIQHAPMVEMYGLGLHVLGRGRVQPGENVVILGAGKLGLSVLDVLRHGARPAMTVVTDLKPDRLAMAHCGATRRCA